MPETACRLAAHYASVSVDGDALQSRLPFAGDTGWLGGAGHLGSLSQPASSGMPDNQTITEHGQRVIGVMAILARENGGDVVGEGGDERVRFERQAARCVKNLATPEERKRHLRKEFLLWVERDLTEGPLESRL